MSTLEFSQTKPTADDVALAQESSRRLAPLLDKRTDIKVQILEQENTDDVVVIPGSAMQLLGKILAEMAEGHAVTLTPIEEELSTQQAADLLNVSRPYLIQLLENGEIPHHKVGTHRRVLADDLLRYKAEIKAKRRIVLKELTAEAQELNLGY